MITKNIVGRMSDGSTDMLNVIVQLVYDNAGRSIGIRVPYTDTELNKDLTIAIDFDQEDIEEFVNKK